METSIKWKPAAILARDLFDVSLLLETPGSVSLSLSLLSLFRRLLETLATNVEHCQLHNSLHAPEQADIILKSIRLPKLHVPVNASPADESRKDRPCLSFLSSLHWEVVLHTPAEANALDIRAFVKALI